ncbi:hypothetical protein FJU08_13715 [Martelella alba]|uniref:LTXXQ motif family protein n=1 Tax=Martelella alba TaxID=2590451 RepID=A0A506U8H1_9HYPH|nr:Spy/CpxP family protein refolding chaperone [Martelella alba]TPW29394.1 hypothetical protein FJU08_13715 [Martelella alba]
MMMNPARRGLAAVAIFALTLPLLPATGASAHGPVNARLCQMLADPSARLANLDPTRMRLAAVAFLADQERAIGITAAQKPAWNSFAEAVISLVPDQTQIDALRNMLAERQSQEGLKSLDVAAFAAQQMALRGQKGTALAKATKQLRAVLSPQQIEAARLPDRRLMPGLSAACHG